jgi:CRISPR-associated endonuclease Csn1
MEKKISQEEKEKIVDFLYANEKPEFKKIRKAIGKESAEFKFNYKDDDKIVGTHTISNLSIKSILVKNGLNFQKKNKKIFGMCCIFLIANQLKRICY